MVVGLKPGGASWQRATQAGIPVMPVPEAAATAQVVMVLTPDHTQAELYAREIAPNLQPGAALAFSHGFNIHYGQIQPRPDLDVFMVAPKAPGSHLRRLYTQGQGVPGLLAVERDASGQALQLALAYAWGIGCTRAGVLLTTFREETETDLFGEQSVLCGGTTSLIKAGFETLVSAGYQPEIAYFECLHELKLIVDLMYEGGLARMRYSVSDTATYGDLTVGPKVIGEPVRQAMARCLENVQSGGFARDWILENQAGRPVYSALERRDAGHQIELVGARLREMMPWLPKGSR